MPYKIAPEITAEIDAFLKQISVAHSLDSEIREELRSHIEEKLCGYMRGEIEITEEEAWLLVREHFGDPAVLKSLYHETEAKEMYKSFFRRIGAAFVAGIWIMTVAHMLFMDLTGLLLKRMVNNPVGYETIIAYGIVWLIPDLLAILLMFYVVTKWRRIVENAGKAWFMTIKPAYFALLIFLSIVCSAAAVMMLYHGQPRIFFESLIPADATAAEVCKVFPGFFGLSYSVFDFFSCFTWLYLCDISPRRFQLIVAGFVSWALTLFVFQQSISILTIFGHPSMIDAHILSMALKPQFHLITQNLFIGVPAFITYCVMALIYSFRQKKSLLTA